MAEDYPTPPYGPTPPYTPPYLPEPPPGAVRGWDAIRAAAAASGNPTPPGVPPIPPVPGTYRTAPPPPGLPLQPTPPYAPPLPGALSSDLFSPEQPMLAAGTFANANEPLPFGPLPVRGAGFTPAQRDMAEADPEMALRQVLKNRGIMADSRLGAMMLGRADALALAYMLMAAGEPGSVTASRQGLGDFFNSYVDIMTGVAPNGDDEYTRTRATLKAQVEAGLKLPNTDIYRMMTRFQKDGFQSERGVIRGPWAIYHALIAPATRAVNSNPLALQIAESRFDATVRNWNMATFEGDTRDFQTFLRETGTFQLPY